MLDKDELRQRIDLVELIGRTVELKREGNVFRGLCPFHADTDPSLCVYPEERRWKCFGCGKGGDCYQWTMELSNVGFKEALDQLREGYGDGNAINPTIPKKTTWDITDTEGNLVAKHERVDLGGGKKKFTWYDKDGKPSTDGKIKPAALPLYRLKHLFDSPSSTIIITEGEKAADALSLRKDVAPLATVTGAASCPNEEAFHPLIGFDARVYLWPDNDPPGYAHMDNISKILEKLGIQPYLIRWEGAPPKGDAHDFLTRGGNIEELLATATPWPNGSTTLQPVATPEGVEQSMILLTGQTIRLTASDIRRERTGIHARVNIYCDSALLAWDTFNVQRNEERNRLAKSAVERMPEGIDMLCDAVTLKGHLDAFAAVLWDKHIEADMPAMVTPPETVPPLTFLVEPYILQGGGTILFAPPGAGKSYTGLLLAVSVDAGINTLWPVTKAKALFVNLERSAESITRRLSMVNRVLGLPPNRPLLMLNRRGRALADIAEGVKRAIKNYGVEVVFLDSISRFGSGDLNENQTANRTIDSLSTICPTWFALGHTPRADASHAYGSVHFDAGADIMVQLSTQSKGPELGVGLTVTKSNDTPKGQMKVYTLTFKDNSLCDARIARPFEFGELALTQKTSPIQDMVNYLLEVGDATATETADTLGLNRSYVSRLFNSSEEFVKTRREGKNQYWGLGERPT